MPIPALNEHGLLPPGIHDCTLAEIEERFGQFHRSDRRCRLFERLKRFHCQATSTGFVLAIIVDGSFVTSKDEPNDIDLVLVVVPTHDSTADLRPFEYNVVSKKRVLREFGFDIVVDIDGTPALAEHVEFFARVREQASVTKGLLRVML
jgi:hypothetical protein